MPPLVFVIFVGLPYCTDDCRTMKENVASMSRNLEAIRSPPIILWRVLLNECDENCTNQKLSDKIQTVANIAPRKTSRKDVGQRISQDNRQQVFGEEYTCTFFWQKETEKTGKKPWPGVRLFHVMMRMKKKKRDWSDVGECEHERTNWELTTDEHDGKPVLVLQLCTNGATSMPCLWMFWQKTQIVFRPFSKWQSMGKHPTAGHIFCQWNGAQQQWNCVGAVFWTFSSLDSSPFLQTIQHWPHLTDNWQSQQVWQLKLCGEPQKMLMEH